VDQRHGREVFDVLMQEHLEEDCRKLELEKPLGGSFLAVCFENRPSSERLKHNVERHGEKGTKGLLLAVHGLDSKGDRDPARAVSDGLRRVTEREWGSGQLEAG